MKRCFLSSALLAVAVSLSACRGEGGTFSLANIVPTRTYQARLADQISADLKSEMKTAISAANSEIENTFNESWPWIIGALGGLLIIFGLPTVGLIFWIQRRTHQEVRRIQNGAGQGTFDNAPARRLSR